MRKYVHFNTQCINNAPHLCKKPRLKQIFKNILAISISLFLKESIMMKLYLLDTDLNYMGANPG